MHKKILPIDLQYRSRIIAFLFALCLFLVTGQSHADAKFDAIRQQGLEAFQERNFTLARDCFQRAYKLQPYNDDIRFRLAMSLIYQDPDAPREAAHQFGKKGSYRDDLQKAVQLLRESVEVQERIEIRSPATGLRHFHLGVGYWYMGRPDLALDSFRRSFRSDFTRTDALYNRIVILKQMGKDPEARVATREYLRITSIEDLDD